MPLTAADVAGQIAGIDYFDEEVDEDFRTDGTSTASRTITVPWDNRITVVASLAGGTTRNGIIDTTADPAAYPDATQLTVKGIKSEGIGVRKVGVNGMVGFDWARLRIQYGTTAKDLGETVDLGGLSLDFSSEIFVPPRDSPSFKWEDDTPLPNDATPALSIGIANFERVRRNVGQIPVALILSLIDHVNDSTFEGAPPGYVMFKGARSFRKITNLGFQNWDLAHSFSYRTRPWNQFFRPSTGQFENIVTIGDGQPFYPEGNLNALYQ